jgi:predicted transcriptional regulator
MIDYTLGAVESRFADIVWAHTPMSTAELVKLCEQELTWKRTTTYTVLKKLSEKGFFQLKDGVVTALVSREDYYASQSEKFVSETFDGSLPAFFAAFTKRKSLSQKELEEIRQMLDRFEEG